MNSLDIVSIRLKKEAALYSEEPVIHPEDAVRLITSEIQDLDREVLCAIFLNSANKPICCNFVSIGTLNFTVASPREILKVAILVNAAGIILIHNHPSGDINPSEQDIKMTKKVNDACNIMEIKLLDHIIIGEGYYSFRENCNIL